MSLISRDELKSKIDEGAEFKLVMALSKFAYDVKHIPGSIQCDDIERAKKNLDPEEEIVLYCAGPSCYASAACYDMLKKAGYKNLYRYVGGIEDWEAAGLPLASNL